MKKLLPILLLLAVVTPVSAAVWNVNIINNAFTPGPLTVGYGDTVHWIWVGSTHSTTSDPGQLESWDSTLRSTGSTFDHTFTNFGTFRYYCSLHGAPNGQGMSSAITVVPEPAGVSALFSLFGSMTVVAVMCRRRAVLQSR